MNCWSHSFAHFRTLSLSVCFSFKLTALIWQLMRAYTLSVLSQVANTGSSASVDKEIVAWVNKKLESAGKTTSIKSFQDSSISNGIVLLDLVDAIKPGSINYEVVNEGTEYEVN